MKAVHLGLDLTGAFENEGMGRRDGRNEKRHQALGEDVFLNPGPSGSERIRLEECSALKPVLRKSRFEDREVPDNQSALFIQKGTCAGMPHKDVRRADAAKAEFLRLQTKFDILVVSAGVEIGQGTDGVGARA